MKRSKPQYILDECVQMKNDLLRRKLGFANASEIVKIGTSDEDLFKAASRRRCTIITQDIRFVLYILSKGKAVVYQNHKKERIHIIPKIKIERHWRIKNHDLITYYLHNSKKIVVP